MAFPKNIDFNKNKGFTLIELSIVLVIIGLIIGGILVGQELIHAAQVRAGISQIYKYNSAVMTFQMKYDGLPGDSANSATFIAATGTANGDGDGLIGSVAGSVAIGAAAAATITASAEYSQFWFQLSTLGLVDGSYQAEASGAEMNNVTNFPATKPNSSVGIFAYGNSADSTNYYMLGMRQLTTTPEANVNNFLSPEDARNFDVKMDDGIPSSGIVVARATGGLDVQPTVSGSNTLDPNRLSGCVIAAAAGTAATQYNTATQTSSLQCALRIRLN